MPGQETCKQNREQKASGLSIQNSRDDPRRHMTTHGHSQLTALLLPGLKEPPDLIAIFWVSYLSTYLYTSLHKDAFRWSDKGKVHSSPVIFEYCTPLSLCPYLCLHLFTFLMPFLASLDPRDPQDPASETLLLGSLFKHILPMLSIHTLLDCLHTGSESTFLSHSLDESVNLFLNFP